MAEKREAIIVGQPRRRKIVQEAFACARSLVSLGTRISQGPSVAIETLPVKLLEADGSVPVPSVAAFYQPQNEACRSALVDSQLVLQTIRVPTAKDQKKEQG